MGKYSGLNRDVGETHSVGISIIMPMYNAENYLLRCLNSIKNQPFDDLEIICIDDASTDSSCSIIHQEIKNGLNIKLYQHATNHGAPTARNLGIYHAAGKYLLFMDADDYLVENSLLNFFLKAEEYGSDAIKGCMYIDRGKGRLKSHPLNQKDAWENTNLASCFDIQHMYQYTTYLFRASTIRNNNIEFDANLKNFQDPVFLSFLLPVCGRIDLTLDPLYVRTIAPNSIITSNWKYENYLSLVRGTTMAYHHLLACNELNAAKTMALTFNRWWYKLELMPEQLSRDECITILEKIGDFSHMSQHLLYRFSYINIGKYHSLKLISRGDYVACYEGLRKSLELKRRLPKYVIRVFDIFRYIYEWSLHKM